MIEDANELRARVWELARAEANPHAVAATLRAELTEPEEIALALDVTLSRWVRHIMTAQTPSVQPKSAPEGRDYDDGMGGKTPNPNRAAALSRYAQELRKSVRVGDSQYLPLGACDAVRLRFAAASRRSKAEENLAAALRYEKLAAALEENNAATVADLPEHVGEAILLHNDKPAEARSYS